MSSRCLTKQEIKAQAASLGFVACGVVQAAPVVVPFAAHYLRRAPLGHFAGMDYMTRHVEMRLQPALLHPGVQTIVSLALNYMPARRQPALCLYAQGEDYHDVMRGRLRMLMERIDAHGRCFVDTAPVMERYWAWRSGVGTLCRNGLVAVPGYGPTVFLGELFLEEPCDAFDVPLQPSPHSMKAGRTSARHSLRRGLMRAFASITGPLSIVANCPRSFVSPTLSMDVTAACVPVRSSVRCMPPATLPFSHPPRCLR